MPGSENTSGAFFQGDTKAGLERLRTRLLDLTKRNKLLHFRHSKKSSLRVVDELPDVLFNSLLDGEKLIFKPVPEPRRNEYLTSITAVPLTEESSSATGDNETESEEQKTDTSLFGSDKPTAKQHAEKLGLATSYDLPLPQEGEAIALRHQDKYIQTLHYPPELESILRRINSAARTAIEESGTNMLYLIVGFLQWYDTDSATEEHYAPLLMLPVTLTRGKPSRETGMFEYTVEYSGEDIVPNLSLLEKLKRDFSLDLPQLEEEDTPETYFIKFKSILSIKPRWQIRRQITLGLVYFGKLLMYRDLDPKNWPAVADLLKHPLIKDFFEGTKHDDLSFSEEYPIDAPELKDEVPLLIFDADSSQHSSLIDALKGKNLVIEGPPGTGKSQTITNLIAAALVQNKTVLFVSEKLAALEVVRRRLDEAGLGTFCLELHSHKTQKKELLEDLDRRIKAKGAFSDPRLLDEKLKLLEKNKQELIAYVELINSKFGALDLKVFDIIWGRERYRQELAFDATLVDLIFLEDADRISFAVFEGNSQTLGLYVKQISPVLRERSNLKDHPWNGIYNAGLDYLREREFVQSLRQLQERTKALIAAVKELSDTTGYPIEQKQETVVELINIGRLLPQPGDEALHSILPNLVKAENRSLLRSFSLQLSALNKMRACLGDGFKKIPSFETQALTAASQACERTKALKLEKRNLQELKQFADSCERSRCHIESLSRVFEQAIITLGCQIPYTADTIGLLSRALASLLEAPLEVLQLRHPDLEEERVCHYLKVAQNNAANLQKLRSRLSKDFFLVTRSSLEEINRHATMLSQAGFFARFFSADYKDAKRCFAQLSRRREKVRRIEMAESLRELVGFLEGLRAFESNKHYQSLFGNHFNGLDTPFEELTRILNWYEKVRANLSINQPVARVLVEALFRCPSQQLRLLHNWINGENQLAKELESFSSVFTSIYDELPDSLRTGTDQNLSGLANRLAMLASEINGIVETLSFLQIRENVPVKDIPELLKQFENYCQARQVLEDDVKAATLLGEHYAGEATDPIRLEATISLAEIIAQGNLATPLKNWLLARDITDRVKKIENWITTISRMYEDFSGSYAEVISLGNINAKFWYAGYKTDPDKPDFISVSDRIFRALIDPNALSDWLDFLRAGEKVSAIKLGILTKLVEDDQIKPEDLLPTYRFVVLNSLVRRVLEDKPSLMKFTGLSHEEIRKRFVEYDLETIELYRQRAAYVIDKRKVPEGVSTGPVRSWTNLSLIKNEIQKQRRHIPIRQLVNRASGTLQALKPCFMMGPLSVAQYLEPSRLKFDLVIMDEASQLKPEDALGAIARSSQMVIVGDPKQLPPTTFFDRMFGSSDGDVNDEDTSAVEDAESILDVASVLYQPIRQLRWHYRSRHGSLIAYSNKEFYGGNLIVFPSPIAKSENLGVKYIPVHDGVYENRKNKIEAESIVDAVLEHMKNNPGESLGVATLNFEQKELIEDLLDEKFKRDPFAHKYLEARSKGAEPFFVKNLETVQGDERDVIFVSVTYGCDPEGNLYQRFGPINGVNGHRRLNVLFTRAKKRTVVFSSMDPTDIRVEAGSTWGLRALKGYLAYAKTGVLEQPKGSAGPAANDFEFTVGSALKARGFEIVPQLGIAGYFIDIAVRHPRKADAYILGVECDGVTYHSGRSARDRDRLRQDVLVNLGWKIHRIWSTDWFKNSKAEIERVIAHLKQILDDEEIAERVSGSFTEERRSKIVSETVIEQPYRSQQDKPPVVDIKAREILTIDEARKQLIDLRENIIKPEFPKADYSRGLLRKTMLETLLLQRPASLKEWDERIPEGLKSSTDEEQITKYLDKVLAILAAISD